MTRHEIASLDGVAAMALPYPYEVFIRSTHMEDHIKLSFNGRNV